MNEAPTVIQLTSTHVNENSPIGTVIGNITVTDPDNQGNYSGRQTFVCLVTSDASGVFSIKNDAQLVVSKASLNYERLSRYFEVIHLTLPDCCNQKERIEFRKICNACFQRCKISILSESLVDGKTSLFLATMKTVGPGCHSQASFSCFLLTYFHLFVMDKPWQKKFDIYSLFPLSNSASCLC